MSNKNATQSKWKQKRDKMHKPKKQYRTLINFIGLLLIFAVIAFFVYNNVKKTEDYSATSTENEQTESEPFDLEIFKLVRSKPLPRIDFDKLENANTILN